VGGGFRTDCWTFRDAGVDLSGIDSQTVTTTNQLIYVRRNKGASTLSRLYHRLETFLIRRASAFHICPLDYEIPLETVEFRSVEES
jgi:hypothetical protein